MQQQLATIDQVREFVVTTFVVGVADPAEVDQQTDLVELGVVDSINVLQLVDFLEEEFDIVLMPPDLFRLVSVEAIVALIDEKLAE